MSKTKYDIPSIGFLFFLDSPLVFISGAHPDSFTSLIHCFSSVTACYTPHFTKSAYSTVKVNVTTCNGSHNYCC